MRSELALPTYDSPLPRFLIAPPRPNRLYLLVEGKSDHQFWAANRRLGGKKRIEIMPMNGRDSIAGNPDKGVDGLPEFFEEFGGKEGRSEEQIRKQIIGVHDDDYERILAPDLEADRNVFSTSPPNDLEALLFDIWRKEGSPTIPFGMWSMEKSTVNTALEIARSVGILRAANKKNRWGIKFRADKSGIQPWLKAGFESRRDPKWFEQALIPKLMKLQRKRVKRRASVRTVILGYKEMRDYCDDHSTPTLSLVNGHDLCKLVELTNDGRIDHGFLERELHLNQRWSKINKKIRKKIDLFRRLDQWSRDSESRMFKWQ